ncbi:hypothetical protein SAMN05216326_12539 [Nitrosomonas marina]|uniref:Uncharacterized protein n=1 Tax=Nitrosomonas marina TaxID=917 RepID=A0A1I0E8Z6_9PROT|nr:hypothetical protein [Nitrosomonas marina]SET40830.1 hypothetical protein SAMN05216326_12539 [Nitrosomonas marina]
MRASEELLKAIAVTAELTDTDLSEAAARVMADDLSEYPEDQVLKALVKCRREVKGRLRISDVVSRLDDGRPGPEEAWAMIPHNERDSVVWTEEMAEAYGIAAPLINDGDRVQARMAFLETYKDRCEKARSEKLPVKWSPSLGFDKNGRERVLLEAVEKGRLSHDHVVGLLPPTPAQQFLIEDKSKGLTKVSDKFKELKLIVSKKNADPVLE